MATDDAPDGSDGRDGHGAAGRAAPTRRSYLRYGGALAAGGLLAGCTSGDAGGDGTGSATDAAATGTDASTRTGTEPGSETATPADGPYSVTMAPMGTVEFDAVPSSVSVYSLLYADMAVAYGHGDAVNSLGFDSAAGGNTLDAYYERLPGVSFDREGLAQLNSGSGAIRVERELLYELDSDLHLADPCLIQSFDGWEAADVEEVATNVGPWFGNTFSRTHGTPPEGCRDGYEYYTLWEIAGKVADVFRERERFERLASVRDDLLARVEADLPPEGERPSVASVILTDGTFYPSRVDTPGFGNAHVRPLGPTDAFAGTDVGFGASVDYETMLEVDPDVVLHQYGIASYYDVGSIRRTMEEHPVGSELSAVRNGRVYPSGNPVQGPLMHLFQLEMTAKQLYPERFGAWPGYDHGDPYPEIPAGERLFDRERVAAIVGGGA